MAWLCVHKSSCSFHFVHRMSCSFSQTVVSVPFWLFYRASGVVVDSLIVRKLRHEFGVVKLTILLVDVPVIFFDMTIIS